MNFVLKYEDIIKNSTYESARINFCPSIFLVHLKIVYKTVMVNFILVLIGGAIGSGSRYLMSLYITKEYPSIFPFGTFAVNIIGCLLIGVIYGLTERFQVSSMQWRLFLATGLCGGFTTFSAFAYENVRLLQTGQYVYFSINTIGSCIFGFAAVFLGCWLSYK